MSTFTIKKGDLIPALTATLMQQVGTAAQTPIDLTTASSLKFAMRDHSTGVVKFDAAATIVTPSAGTVKYTWAGTDTDTAGVYDCEWQIVWPSGKQTVPAGSFDTVTITADIAA